MNRLDFLNWKYNPIEGIELATINKIRDIINDYFEHNQNCNITIKYVSEKSGIDKATVKTIFFILLAYGYLVATFLPVHKWCGETIGEHEEAVKHVEGKAINGEYKCDTCKKSLGFNDIEIHLIFWNPGISEKMILED